MPEIRDANRVFARNEDVILYRGDIHTFQFELLDYTGEGPFNLSGKTVKLAAKTNLKHSTLVWDKTGTVVGNGIVTFSMTAADLATAQHLIAEVRIIDDGSGDVNTALQFTVCIVEDVA